MNHYINLTLTIIISSVITFVTGTFGTYLTLPNGSIRYLGTIEYSNEKVVNYLLENTSNKMLSNVKVLTSSIVNTSDIYSSGHGTIESTESGTGGSIITIGSIGPRYSFQFSLKKTSDNMKVKFPSAKNQNIDVTLNKVPENIIQKAMLTGLIMAILYGIVIFIFSQYEKHRIDKLQHKLNESNDEIKSIKESINTQKSAIKDTSIKYERYRVLLLKRLSDAKKENAFYRRVILEIIGRYNHKICNKLLFSKISDILKTHSVASNTEFDIEYIELLSNELSDINTLIIDEDK